MNTLNNCVLQCFTFLFVFGVFANLEAIKQTTTSDEVLIEGGGGMIFDATKDELIELHRNLRFEPPEIDFGLWSVGVARSHKVMLVNENANRSVYLNSLSGRTPIFYASFFETRVIPPLSNTTFDVVFLPRKNVLATDLLTVHTSFGQARLLVRGEGLDCPYRLKPIVGIKAPLNALLTPELYMYNPHERPLQIIEIYSSGGQFQLELPSGLSSAPQALWEIPPHTTKPIIRIKFHGNSAGNHTAFIRIKIAAPKAHPNVEDVLVVPVEFEILPKYGKYTENPILDFGRLTNVKSKTPIQLKMQLQNSDKLASGSLETVSLMTDENLLPGLSFEYNDGGKITLDTVVFNKTTTIDELLTLQSKSESNTSLDNIFTIRVRAEIFNGTLYFNRNASIFVTGVARSPCIEPRILNVRNDFEQPLAIFNISIVELNFKAINVTFVEDYKENIVLQPGETRDLFHLQLKDERSSLQTSIHILTNITDFKLPLIVCTGRLHVSTHHEPILLPDNIYNTELNMGAVPLEEMSSEGYIALQNPHPINVRVVNWNFKSPHGVYFHTTSMGCLRPAALSDLKSNKSVAIENANFRFCSTLSEGDIMVFQVAIQSHVIEFQMATLQIWTPHETITTTILFHTWVGKLEVDQEELYFKNCFPGKICTSDFSIRSTFQHPIHITAINFTDDSIRFPNDETKKLVFALTPNAVTRLGRIYFEPALHCHNRCYLPYDEKFNSLAFPKTSTIENNNFHFDETELRRRTDLYRQMKRHFRTISFMLNSRELRQVQLQAIIDIKWPKLVVDGAQKMQTIEAGNSHHHIIHIKNPIDKPILVDYFLANPEYAQKTKLSLPVEVVDMSSNCYLTDQLVFSLDSPVKEPILIPPYGNLDVSVRFNAPPKLTDNFCTLLHVRNNLTLYEAVWISAKSVQSQFRFGNRKPGAQNALSFDVQEKNLAACQHQLPVYVKRTFTARNTGEVPIRIDSFMVDDEDCEGYGFRVMDCDPFELKANESRKIEIVFRPDFTQLRISRTLRILSNLSYDINYALFAQLPSADILNQCSDIMERPDWEAHIRIASVLLLLTSFILVIAGANIEAESIRRSQSALYMAREKGAVQPTFNLRNIAMKTTTATTTNKPTNKGSNNNQTHQHTQRQQQQHKTNNYNNNSSHHHQQNQHKNNRRRFVTNQRKYSISTESITSNDTNESKPNFDEKLNLDFDERLNNWQDSYDCSPSSSSNSGSFKSSPSPPKSVEERNLDKKQKTPPMQAAKLKNSNRKGKSTIIQSPPPPASPPSTTTATTRNTIIDLMDKDVTENINTKLTKPKTEPTLLKRITESIAAAVSSKDKGTVTLVSEKPKDVKPKEKEMNVEKPKPNRQEEIKPDSSPMINITKTFEINNENVTKNQTKDDSTTTTLTQSKTPINDLNIIQNSKQKSQDFNTNNFKQSQSNNVKATNYIGPIRNMDKSQTTQNTQTATNASPTIVSQTKNSNISIQQKPKTNENIDPRTRIESNGHTPSHSRSLQQATPVNNAVMKPLSFNNVNSPPTEMVTTNQTLKYGKTPGRERTKEQTKVEITNNPQPNNQIPSSSNVTNLNANDSKCSDKISKNKVVKTLNFDEHNNFACTSINANSNSLSETTALPKAQPTLIAPIHVDTEKGAVYIDLKKTKHLNQTEVDNNSNALPPEKSNVIAKSISNIVNENAAQLQQQKSTELGPIGSKKSPSSTPVWESVVGNTVTVKKPLQPKILDPNSSFFSNIPPTAQVAPTTSVVNVGNSGNGCNDNNGIITGTNDGANFDFNAAQSILGNVTTASLYELKKAQVELQRQLEANEFLLNLRRKQLEDQQRQQQQQQELLKSITQWPRTSNVTTQENSTWGPIGFTGNSNVMGYKENENKKSLTPTLDDFDAWPSTTSASIRPPPGLGGLVGTTMPAPPGLGQQQQQQIQRNNINNNNNNNNINANNIGNSSNTTSINSQNDGVRTFDPFSSLGSIWSDNWTKRSNNRNN